MTAAVGRVAAGAVGKSGGGAAVSRSPFADIAKPPPDHFDTPAAPSTSDSPQSTASATPAKKTTPAKKAPAKKAAPKDNTQGQSGEKAKPDTESGGLSIGPPKMQTPQVPSAVNTGAGFILGLLFWTWVALPFLNNGGVTGVKNQLRAKFLNKAPDGSWLP